MEVIPWLGATPVFVDLQRDTFNIDADHREASIEQLIGDGKLTPKVIIAVVTNDAELAERIDSLRVHEKATASDKEVASLEHDPTYLNTRVGMNSRLKSIQATPPIEKLAIFADEIEKRNVIAARYNEFFAPNFTSLPHVADGVVST